MVILNLIFQDFRLLVLLFTQFQCSGTRATLEKYEKCNMGKVRANAVVTRGGSLYNETEISAFTNLFVYAQQFYSRKDGDEFRYLFVVS